MWHSTNRIENPSPELLFQEINLPHEGNFATGSFRTKTKPNTLTPPTQPAPKAITAIAIKKPDFQISININPGTRQIPVLLGRADGTDPLTRAVFLLPHSLDTATPHDFTLYFQDWQVISFTMDGTALDMK